MNHVLECSSIAQDLATWLHNAIVFGYRPTARLRNFRSFVRQPDGSYIIELLDGGHYRLIVVAEQKLSNSP